MSVDPRNFRYGITIPSEGYCDQPYVIKCADGSWLCAMTTGMGKEGQPGQHIVSYRSLDKGVTWIDKRDVEPADGPSASWSVLFRHPSGRIYCFYTFNKDGLREVETTSGKATPRVDTLGDYAFRYSDDHGKSWSEKRYSIPLRAFAWDKENPYKGEVLFFWNVGRPFVQKDRFFLPLHKVGCFGAGFMEKSEGAFAASDDFLKLSDPDEFNWITLPDGDIGLRSPGKENVADEQHTVPMENGSLFCNYRTIEGYLAAAYSRDNGHTWDQGIATYTPDGRTVKNSRACPALWKIGKGRYLRWYHNNGKPGYNNGETVGSRNIVWLSGGIEKGDFIHWSEPELAFYVGGQWRGLSYPDLVIEDDEFFIFTTNKLESRIAKISPVLISAVFNELDFKKSLEQGLVFEYNQQSENHLAAPRFNQLCGDIQKWNREASGENHGQITFNLKIKLNNDSKDGRQKTLVSTRRNSGTGCEIILKADRTLRIELYDGWGGTFHDGTVALRESKTYNAAFVVDGGPSCIYNFTDGEFDDGGEIKDMGFSRFNPTMKNISGADQINIDDCVKELLIYDRPLYSAEIVFLHHAQV